MKGLSLTSTFCAALALHILIHSSVYAQPAPKVLNYQQSVDAVQFSPDGKLLAIVTGGNLVLLDATKYKPSSIIPVLRYNGLYGLTFSPDSKKIAAVTGLAGGTTSSLVVVWNVATGSLEGAFKGHLDFARSVAFSPNGKLLASGGGEDKTVRVWDVAKGTEALKIALADSKEVTGVVFHPDGKKLFSCGRTGLKLWDVSTGKELPPPSDEIKRFDGYHLIMSSDGSRLAGSGKGIIICDLKTGHTVAKGTRSSAWAKPAFSPDGSK